MKRIILAAIAAAVTLGAVGAAEARPYDHHRGYHRGYHHNWHNRGGNHHRYYYRHGRRYWH